MSTSIFFTFDQSAEGARMRDFATWANGNGLHFEMASDTWRRDQVEADYRTKRNITFSTCYMGEQMTGLINLALSFWQRFGGSMQAAPEVMIRIRQAFVAMNPSRPEEA